MYKCYGNLHFLSKFVLIALLCFASTGCQESPVLVKSGADHFQPIIERVEQGKASNIHSLLAWQNGQLLLELYRQGGGLDGNYQTSRLPIGPDELHNIHSVTKSFVATLIFIAIDEGKISSLEAQIFDFFPEYEGGDRKQKEKIRLRDVLNMSTGYALDELSVPYSDGVANVFSRHYHAKDVYQQFVETEVAFEPGTRFSYSGLSTIGLSKVIERAYGKPFTQVMKEKLFEPLSITNYQWLAHFGSGEAGADWGLRLTSRDMGKFGLMWLDGGVYGGRQIVAKHWLEQLKTSRFSGYKMGYGLHFWQVPSADAVMAVGYGEQYIAIIPSKKAVVVTTAGNYKLTSQPVLGLIQQLVGEL
ncbi:serine hydrolase domain-containing protein [Vibrio cionasavignyae]|uniref:serine hydrolase domain-containing protein n=1 Tax=Vibrio cionasavignyae TaxID=2910252 RepID=UPI003D0A5128